MQNPLNRLRAISANVNGLLAAALQWWWSELSAVFSPLMHRLGYQSAPVFFLTEPSGVPALVERGEMVNSSLAAPQTRAEHRSGKAAHVSLHASLVMRFPILLPRTALSELRTAVRFQLLNESPIPVDEVLFDAQVSRSSTERSRAEHVVVDVALCRRSTVESLCQHLETAGVSGSIIGHSISGASPLTFVFYRSRAAKEAQASSSLNRRLVFCAIAILLGALPTTYLGAQWLTAQVRDELDTLRSEHDAMLLRYEQQSAAQAAQVALVNHIGNTRLSNVLDEMAERLPNSVWLRRIQYDNSTLSVQAYATDPATAAKALEGSRLLTRITIDSVTGAGEMAGTPVQFALSAAIKQGNVP